MVIDASALVELLLGLPAADLVQDRIKNFPGPLNGPHLLDAEVVHVIRRFEARGSIDRHTGLAAIRNLSQFPLKRHSHDVLVERAWELRHNLSAYDAIYVALAEAMSEPLLTRDRRVANAAGHRAQIELV